MKRFLSTLAVWAVLMLLGTFFFAHFFWGHIFRTALLLAVVFTFITLAFLDQGERMDALAQRLRELEERCRPK